MDIYGHDRIEEMGAAASATMLICGATKAKIQWRVNVDLYEAERYLFPWMFAC